MMTVRYFFSKAPENILLTDPLFGGIAFDNSSRG